MGGLFELLAMLPGWDYRVVSGTTLILPGQPTPVFSENVKGWLLLTEFDSNDAYAHITVKMPPEQFNVLDLALINLANIGLTIPIAQTMTLTLFNFPGLIPPTPSSSVGVGAAFFNLPNILPLKRNNNIQVSFTLDPGTTESSAVVDYQLIFAQIYETETFANALKDALSGKWPT
jgi:hypothetical protein